MFVNLLIKRTNLAFIVSEKMLKVKTEAEMESEEEEVLDLSRPVAYPPNFYSLSYQHALQYQLANTHVMANMYNINPVDLYTANNQLPQQSTSVALTRGGRPTRPFKAYPKDPLAFTFGKTTTEGLINQASTEAYLEFRQRMMVQVQSALNTKIRSPSTSLTSSETDETKDNRDPSYVERRKKNNEAAKRSRESRRKKEDEIAIRVAFLEKENMELKLEVIYLRDETEKYHYLIYNN